MRRHCWKTAPFILRDAALAWRRRACAAILLALALGAPAAVVAAAPLALDARSSVDLVAHVDVLEDATGALTLADVQQPGVAERFRPAPSGTDINFGYTRSAYWLRFSLHANDDTDRLLEVAFPTLDDVQFFEPLAGGRYRRTATGDLQPFEQRAVAHRHFVFPIELDAGHDATYYLRIASEGSLTIPLELWPRDAFHDHDRTAYTVLALYFGMLIALSLYNLLLFLSLRDPGYLAYVVFAVAMGVGQATLSGLGNQYLWPDWTNWGDVALPAGFALAGLFGALFTRILLDTRRIAPFVDHVIVAHMALFAVGAVLPAVAPYRYAAVLITLTGASFAVSAVVAGVVCLRRGLAGARYFLIAWTLLLAGALVLCLRNMGWLPTNFFTIHAMLIGSSFEMLLLSLALAHRISVLTADREHMRDEALAAARRAEQELESKVATRTRELGLANAELESTLATLERVAATDRLTGAWNRRWFEQAAHAEIERARRHADPLSLIVIDIDRFKQINDRHGHAVGDKVLITIADLIGENIRSSDSLTRWGGEEFLVLAPATALAGAAQLAEKLRRRIELTSFGMVGSMTISVGVCQYLPGQRLEDFIAAADAAMYRAKQQGRNRVATNDAPADRATSTL